jgi:prepilin-type N-terminal cleavage/methylation domain-containing protein
MCRARPRRSRSGQGGFTVVELAVSMTVLGVLLAMAVPAWSSYRSNQERLGATREVVSILRNAQLRAVAEETSYRVDVLAATNTLAVHRFDGKAYLHRSTTTLTGSSVLLQAPAFRDKTGAVTTTAYFYARGTASPGGVTVASRTGDRRHVIDVEGLTGRVSSS